MSPKAVTSLDVDCDNGNDRTRIHDCVQPVHRNKAPISTEYPGREEATPPQEGVLQEFMLWEATPPEVVL